MNNEVKKYAELLASMCIDFINGGIDEETFKANLKEINAALNEVGGDNA